VGESPENVNVLPEDAVQPPIPTTLDAHPTVVQLSPLAVTLRLSATLTDESGAPIAGQPVRFVIGGRTVCTGVTDANGLATCTAAGPLLRSLLHLGYQAVYDGDSSYAPSTGVGAIVR
jgi:hypothetical protein